MRILTTILCILLAHNMARGQTGSGEWRYWFDEDDSNVYSTLDLGDGAFDIDVSMLPEGFHLLHLQALRNDTLSAPVTRVFTKAAVTEAADTYKGLAVIDGGAALIEAEGTMNNGQLSWEMDVTSLQPGLHTCHVQGVSPQGVPMESAEAHFVRTVTNSEEGTMACNYSIDNAEVAVQEGTFSGGKHHFDIDVSALADGIHELNYWLVADNGTSTTRGNAFFIKTTHIDPAAVRCYYTLDNVTTTPQEGTISDGVLHFNLDVTGLSDGLHEVSYWVVADNGSVSTPESAYFIKVPEGGTGIIEYEYWFNDEFDNRRTITLDERVDPLSVITDIEVEPQDLRSCSFDVVMVDGQPFVVAKNDLHFRFTDIGGRMTDVDATYVDGRVTQEVTDILPIEPQHTVTAPRPAENTIQWFSAEALEGDSLLFRASSGCVLQLFSPTGELVYETDADGSTSFGGTEATESGTYYLALHEMEGSARTVKVTYRVPDMAGWGDVNGDGQLNVSDISSIVDIILGQVSFSVDEWNADINNDGILSIQDITMLVDIILGN
ncbi:MAG: dockerin type I repeat-containing protein [Prevotella sp.]|nr:dockerin type I repeat-containing protein [Prevotella sp.]